MNTIKIYTLQLLSLLLFACGNFTEQPKTPEQLRAELEINEIINPTKYLSAEDVKLKSQQKMVRKGGLFRNPEYAPDGVIITGNISNSASIADFKDVTIKVTYYSKTNSILDEARYTIYEYFKQGTTTAFSIKTKEEDTPNEFESFNLVVEDARPAMQD